MSRRREVARKKGKLALPPMEFGSEPAPSEADRLIVKHGHLPFSEWDMREVNSSGRVRKAAMDVLADRVFPFIVGAFEENRDRPLKINEAKAILFFDALRGSLATKVDEYDWVATRYQGCREHPIDGCPSCEEKHNRCAQHESLGPAPFSCNTCKRVEDAIKQEFLQMLSTVPKFEHAQLVMGAKSKGMLVAMLGMLKAQAHLFAALNVKGFAEELL